MIDEEELLEARNSAEDIFSRLKKAEIAVDEAGRDERKIHEHHLSDVKAEAEAFFGENPDLAAVYGMDF